MREFSDEHRKALSRSHKGRPKLGGRVLTLDDCAKGGKANKSNLTGMEFGNLVVLREGPRSSKSSNAQPRPHWWCLCRLCGKEKSMNANALKSGKVVSCGCKKTHAYWVTQTKVCFIHKSVKEMRTSGSRSKFHCAACGMWAGAKARAASGDIPFLIKKEDINIPDFCPIRGTPFVLTAPRTDDTPTLDRIVPTLGYIPGNVSVISFRANRLKQDATEVELEALLHYVKTRPSHNY
jgi:hypothetical protein